MCKINRTIVIANIEGLRLEGDGRDRTDVRWIGNDAQDYQDWLDDPASNPLYPMFSIHNSSGLHFADFGIHVSADRTLISAFDMVNACVDATVTWGDGSTEDLCAGYNDGDGPGTHGNSFHDLRINSVGKDDDSALVYGVRILLPEGWSGEGQDLCDSSVLADCGNDAHSFNELHVTTFRDTAFLIEGQQSVGHVFRHTHCRGTLVPGVAPLGGGTVDYDNVANNCVRTGRDGEANSAGSFSWYGGLANGLRDAVFRVGSNPEVVHIAGGYTEVAAALLKGEAASSRPGGTGRPTGTSRPGGVRIESYYFNTDYLDVWVDGNTAYNPQGIIVDMHDVGPLSMYNNLLGYFRGTNPDGTPRTQERVSLCWSDPYGDVADISSFVFEGNAIGTANDNPFHPTDGTNTTEGCIYPTVQRSNLIAAEDNWEAMPQHFGVLDVAPGTSSFSVNHDSSSHNYFEVEGMGQINCLEDGYQGQRVVLVGSKDLAYRSLFQQVKIENKLPVASWGNSCRNIALREGKSMRLGAGETLTLVKGDDTYWYELDRSEN